MTPLVLSLLAVGAHLCAAEDDVLLLQSHLQDNNDDVDRDEDAAARDWNLRVDENVSNESLVPAPAFKMYRLNIYGTHGSDHVCMTELSFLNMYKAPLEARLTHMSSCYGCPISCDGCEADFGNPAAQFDKVTDKDSFTAWSCTAPATFDSDGLGNQTIQFTLKERPAKGTIYSSTENGSWAPKAFALQEQQADGKWFTIGLVDDQGQSLQESFFIQPAGSIEDPPKWPISSETCGSNTFVDAVDVVPDNDIFVFQYQFTPVSSRTLAHNALYGCKHGMSVDGEFGSIVTPNGPYEVRQLATYFPSKYRLDGDLAEGELHIIIQKQGSPGLFDTAVIVILLQLPEETNDMTPTEQFFINLGLQDLPAEGSSRKLANPVDLSVFNEQFAGGVSTADCAHHESTFSLTEVETVPWWILTRPAFVSGSVVLSMHNGPPAVEEQRSFDGFTGAYTSFVAQYGEDAAVKNWDIAVPFVEQANESSQVDASSE